MSYKNKSIYLCLLDNVDLEKDITLGEFEIRYLKANQVSKVMQYFAFEQLTPGEKERLATYEKFPWAYFERDISDMESKDSVSKSLVSFNLRFAHAGVMNWWPFTELIRTLNLLKPSLGPVILRHFYHIPFADLEHARDVEKVIYSEPSINIFDDERGTQIQRMLFGYEINQKSTHGFSELRTVLARCLLMDNVRDNNHIRTAVHNFENADRKFVPCPLEGSFNAVDPLMSYEAALESLVIFQDERGVENKLASRISSGFGEKAVEVENFLRKVFWLRSKVTHGARPIEEIERLILRRPNDAINDEARNKRIPAGNYDKLLLESYTFPGFLINLREITRFTIRLFCDEFNRGCNKDETVRKLKR
ncbi:hypothetical protein ES703_94693 [subsurface metagenome]